MMNPNGETSGNSAVIEVCFRFDRGCDRSCGSEVSGLIATTIAIGCKPYGLD